VNDIHAKKGIHTLGYVHSLSFSVELSSLLQYDHLVCPSEDAMNLLHSKG
jgi:hypothetical protein